MIKSVPKSLRTWFMIHFFVDMIFGIPLLLYPQFVANLFGMGLIEEVTARIVGAALLGIGGASYFAHKSGRETYDALLTLKIIWSIGAILAIVLSDPIIWPGVVIFGAFSAVWIFYKTQISI